MTGIERRVSADNRDQGVEAFARQARQFLPGRDIVLSVSEAKRERSQSQLGALFGVAYKILMREIGLRGEREKAELHRFFCCEYWGTKATVFGERIPARTTSTNERGQRDVLSTREQLEFYAFIQQRAAEQGFDVPDPDPMWRDRERLDAEGEEAAARARRNYE